MRHLSLTELPCRARGLERNRGLPCATGSALLRTMNRPIMGVLFAGAICAAGIQPLSARDSLGVVERWGAFRDPATPRCYAISEPVTLPRRDAQWKPFASVGYWPRRGVRGQINIRLSRALKPGTDAVLAVDGQRFALVGGGADVWARDRQDDAAILAALRSGSRMLVGGVSEKGNRFADEYQLRGAATAIDAAALGCARLK